MRRFGGGRGGGGYVEMPFFYMCLCALPPVLWFGKDGRFGALIFSCLMSMTGANGVYVSVCVQGIPLSNFHVVDGLSRGLGLGVNAGATGPGGGGGGGIETVEREILRAVDAARGVEGGGVGNGRGRVLLVLDGLDFLIAAMGVTAGEMADLVGEVREVCTLFVFSFLKIMSSLLRASKLPEQMC